MGNRSRVLLAVSLCALLFAACAPASKANPTFTPVSAAKIVTNPPPAPTVVGPVKWNTQDPNASTNGNGRLVAALLKSLPADELRRKAESVPPAVLRKAPWDHYGKLLRLSGQVAEARDLPRGGQVARDLGVDHVGELVVVADDGTRLTYAHLGSVGQVRPGQKVAVCGYVVGLSEVGDGASGGAATPYVVGKDIQPL